MKNLHPRSKLIAFLAAVCLALACFALSPQARAVCPQGCSDGNTFLGESALVKQHHRWLYNNTATGGAALFSNTTGNHNTANGVSALISNTTGANRPRSCYYNNGRQRPATCAL